MDTTTAPTGAQLKQERQALRLSFNRMVELTGLTPPRLYAIESRGKEATEDELAAIRKALTDNAGAAPAPRPRKAAAPKDEAPAPRPTRGRHRTTPGPVTPNNPQNEACKRVVDVTDWCGLSLGDSCRVRRLSGWHGEFRRFVRQANDHEYVEVIVTRGKRRLIRCVTPDRVLNMKGQPVQAVWLAANPESVPAIVEDAAPVVADDTEDDDI